MGRSGRDAGGRRAAVAGAWAVVALSACGRAAAPPAVERAAGDGGFLAPPSVVGAGWTSAGGVRLAGRAPPDAIVRLQAPDGRALGVTADAAGRWTAELPPAAAPELFALSAEVGPRTVRAEGALATAPPGSAAAALVTRAGAASAIAGPAPPVAGPVLQVIDFDGGGVAAAGRSAPGATLKLMVDGAAVGAGQADGAGRFGLTGVGAPLSQGVHRVRVEAAPGAGSEAAVDTAAAAPLGGGPFRAARAAGGWRVDWAQPGGGVQSLLLLDASRADAQGGARP